LRKCGRSHSSAFVHASRRGATLLRNDSRAAREARSPSAGEGSAMRGSNKSPENLGKISPRRGSGSRPAYRLRSTKCGDESVPTLDQARRPSRMRWNDGGRGKSNFCGSAETTGGSSRGPCSLNRRPLRVRQLIISIDLRLLRRLTSPATGSKDSEVPPSALDFRFLTQFTTATPG